MVENTAFAAVVALKLTENGPLERLEEKSNQIEFYLNEPNRVTTVITPSGIEFDNEEDFELYIENSVRKLFK